MNTIQETRANALEGAVTQLQTDAIERVGTNSAASTDNEQEITRKESPEQTTSSLEQPTPSNDEQGLFDEIEENLRRINEFLPVNSTNLVFEFDKLGEPPVVKVIDRANDEVIREIPPQEIRDIAKAFENLADNISTTSGILVNDSA